jgi:hypothetical protein
MPANGVTFSEGRETSPLNGVCLAATNARGRCPRERLPHRES